MYSEKKILQSILDEALRDADAMEDEVKAGEIRDHVVATRTGLAWNFSRIDKELGIEAEIKNLKKADECYNQKHIENHGDEGTTSSCNYWFDFFNIDIVLVVVRR